MILLLTRPILTIDKKNKRYIQSNRKELVINI